MKIRFQDDFCDGFARIQVYNFKYNFIDKQGNLLSPDMWFEWAGNFHNGVALVHCYNGLSNYINTKGRLLSPNMWFIWVSNFNNGIALVQRNTDFRCNFIDPRGNILFPATWFIRIEQCQECFKLNDNNMKYFMDRSNRLHRLVL